ncbi:VanZ family protein [Glutamicibacter sp.]|uniref:VanZ family protein n=1 Tax=Glutamicibacter sp. TaxID=1931995 RepID=UPI0028BE368C|nr:VanZ family protein [Glutamicibacter sp.]
MKTSHLRLSIAVFLTYLIAVLLVAFWPVPVDRPIRGSLDGFIEWLHRHGLPKIFGYREIEFTANILFFVPMGSILAMWNNNRFVAVSIATYVSISIETVQELALPQRYSSVFDILANTLGAVLGTFLFYPLVNLLITRYDHYKLVRRIDEVEEQENAGAWLSERLTD